MLKDRPHLCQYMPKRKDARRLVADPVNEPDFYKITQEHPLSRPASHEAEPSPKRARFDDSSSSVSVPSVAAVNNSNLPQTSSLFDDVNSATVLLALIEAKRKEEQRKQEEQKQAALATMVSLLTGQQQQQPQQSLQGPGLVLPRQPSQSDAANIGAFLTLLNQLK